MRFLFVFGLLVFLSSFSATSRKSYPKGYFSAPISQQLRLSGTFGELRPNHFHSGIDIKGSTGIRVMAAADGYVYRVKVQKDGYGNALYLKHPNGYSTVYAHLHEFAPEIEQYVRQIQYEKQRFEVDLAPQKGKFSFRKGEQIGKMGNTGSSGGPHLHFEIRDGGNEKPINPLLFGLKVADQKEPRMHELKVYHLNDKLETLRTKSYKLLNRGNGSYQLDAENNTLTIGAWRAGFGLKVFDHMDGVSNWNGIYSLEMYVDDSLYYAFEMETFDFGESRYLNAHLDYEDQVVSKSYVNRTYVLPGNRLSTYRKLVNRGVVKLYANKPSRVRLVACDVAGNKSRLEFLVKRGEVPSPAVRDEYSYILPYDQENIIDNYSIYLRFPRRSFYEDLYLFYDSANDASSNIYSAVHTIHHYKTPVHRYFEIGIRPTILPDELRPKAFIAYCGKGNRIVNYGGKWENGMLKTKARILGDYCIMVDQTPPVIQPVDFQENMQGYNRMTFKISDDIPAGGYARGLSYKATIDGRWILMEYDEKNDLITYRFEDDLKPGSHELSLVVTDSQSNRTVFSRSFTR